MTTTGARLAGKRILVAEDDWFIARSLARDLRRAGAAVSGPVSTLRDALGRAESEPLDGAVLDVNLRDGTVFAAIDLLAGRNVPVVLATGYSLDALPLRYRHVPRCTKPVELGALARALFP